MAAARGAGEHEVDTEGRDEGVEGTCVAARAPVLISGSVGLGCRGLVGHGLTRLYRAS